MQSGAAALVALAVLAACAALAALAGLAPPREGFSFARDVCDSINKESRVYLGSPRLQALCSGADDINPERTCLVDCDIAHLCGNPSVGLCRQAQSAPALCEVSGDYYGHHPDNSHLPNVYRVRRGVCISMSTDGRAIRNAALRSALMRFPESLAVVGTALTDESPLTPSWSVTLADSRTDDNLVELPLASPDYASRGAEMARELGVSASVPSAVLHESCLTPSGQDTCFVTDPAALQDRLARARDHENQPGTLHVTALFTLPDTTQATVGGLAYLTALPGQPRAASPVSGKPLSARTTVWLMAEVSPKLGVLGQVREVLVGSDGTTHVTMVRPPAGLHPLGDGPFVAYSGQHPELWLGMRDAAADLTRL